MNDLVQKTLIVGICLLAFSLSAFGQQKAGMAPAANASVGRTMLNETGQVTAVVAGAAGKAAWATTKFTAKHVGNPILLKAAPKAGLFLLKESADGAKYILSTVRKLNLLR